MTIQIIQQGKIGDGFYLRASSDKTTAWVHIKPWGVNVCVENSAHKVWRRGGKNFRNVEEALNNYKKADVKAIINLAVELSKETTSEKIRVRACSIQCDAHPEWGTFGVTEDRGDWFEIIGDSGSRVLYKTEANEFWSVVN